MKFVTTFFCLILVSSCANPLKIIYYEKIQDDIFSNTNLKHFLKENATPTVVLRVPNPLERVGSLTPREYNLLFNTIEKEFMKAGFSVKDRDFFNEMANKAGTGDYTKIRELTDTDLILEIMDIDPAVVYNTHTVTLAYKKKQRQQIQDINYRRYGARVEYKLIIVRNKEIGGVYKFNYTPCADGCEISTFTLPGENATQTKLRETLSGAGLEKFIKYSTRDLIKSIEQNQ